MLYILVSVLVFWMLSCAYCGFRGRFLPFFCILSAGLLLNLIWMVWGLQADPFEINVLIAQAAALLYALCALSIGWFAARIRRAWVDSQITKGDI